MAATLKIPTTFTAVDKFSSVIKTMTKGIKSWSNKSIAAVRRFDQKITKTFNKLSRFAQAGLGLGVGFLAREAINIVKDYEQSLADLSAVMNTTKSNQLLLRKDSERLGASTAKSATEVVGLQEEFARLGFVTPQIIAMTEATISGSIAMNGELSETAMLVGAVVKTFDNFSSIDTPDIIDKMTLSTQKSALNFEKLKTGLPIVSGAANAAGIPFERLLALMGKLSDAGIDASSSSTALRNIFLDSAKKGHTYTQILQNIEKNQNKLTAANDAFGKRGAVSATILSGKLQEVDKFTTLLTEKFSGAAKTAAETRLDTFAGSLTLLSSAYQGLLIKQNETSGALIIFRNIIDFVTKNIDTLALAIGIIVGLFITMKTVLIAATIWSGAYNIAIGIMGGLSGVASVAIGQSTVALGAYKVASRLATIWSGAYNIAIGAMAAFSGTAAIAIGKSSIALGAYKVALAIATGAQWLLNAALTANPIGLVIVAIAALIGLVVLIINNYEKWGAVLAMMLGPLGFIINLVQSFRRNWDMIKQAFKEGGIMAGIKAIGKVILDAILMPMQQLLELISKIPGKIGRMAAQGVIKIQQVRENLGVDTGDKAGEVLSSPETASSQITTETIQKGTIDINIKDKGNNVEKIDSRGELDIPIVLTNTQGVN